LGLSNVRTILTTFYHMHCEYHTATGDMVKNFINSTHWTQSSVVGSI
jgi:hypothetical protein